MSVQAAMNNLVSSSLGFLNQTFSMMPSFGSSYSQEPVEVETEEPEVEQPENEESSSIDTAPDKQSSQKAAAEQNAYNRIVEKVEGQSNQQSAMQERLDMIRLKESAVQAGEEK